MKHQTETQTFGRSSSHRSALYNQLTSSLIEYGRIKTTLAKAKAIRGLVDQVVTYAKDGSLHAMRQARGVIKNKTAFKRLFSEIRDEFNKLPNCGGYTRIFHVGHRKGDNAPMVLMELLNFTPKVKSEKDKKGKESESAEAAGKPKSKNAKTKKT